MSWRGKACAALRLVLEAGATEAELLVLLELGRVPKSKTMRIFHSAVLARRRFLQCHLRASPQDLDAVLRSLVRKGFLSPAGRHRYLCTREGDLMKHELSGFSRRLQVHRRGVTGKASIAWVRELLRVLRAICGPQARRNPAESSSGAPWA